MSEAAATPPLEPTKPGSWKAPETKLLPLSGGNVVRVKKPDLLGLLTRGDIPNPMIGIVQRAFDEGEVTDAAAELAARAMEAGRTAADQLEFEIANGLMAGEEAEKLRETVGRVMSSDDVTPMDGVSMINVIVFGALVEPAGSFDPPISFENPFTTDGKLSIHGLLDEDRTAIFRWATAEVDVLARFRGDGAGADPERGGGALQPAAEQHVRSAVESGVG